MHGLAVRRDNRRLSALYNVMGTVQVGLVKPLRWGGFIMSYSMLFSNIQQQSLH